MLKWITGLVLVFGLTYEVYGLDVAITTHNGEPAIHVSGEYYEHDDIVFMDIAKANPDVNLVVLSDSDGGLTAASYPISRYIRDNGMRTVVLADAECVSSCSIVWLGGADRSIEPSGSVWMHLPYMPAESMWDYLVFDEYCEEGKECRNWSDTEKLEIYLMQNLRAVGVFYDFMIEMNAEPGWISGVMKTNPWSFYTITGE